MRGYIYSLLFIILMAAVTSTVFYQIGTFTAKTLPHLVR